jgi:hypothetical protein
LFKSEILMIALIEKLREPGAPRVKTSKLVSHLRATSVRLTEALEKLRRPHQSPGARRGQKRSAGGAESDAEATAGRRGQRGGGWERRRRCACHINASTTTRSAPPMQ